MTAPFPDFTHGQIAQRIVGHYVWLARWSNEIGNDTDMDLKKVAQLAFAHCRDFAALVPAGPIPPGLVKAVFRKAEAEGIDWATPLAVRTDLALLRDQSAALFAWVRDNKPEVRSFATRTYDGAGLEIDVPTKIVKDAAIAVEVAKLRALFD